jgi:hypothetical protein
MRQTMVTIGALALAVLTGCQAPQPFNATRSEEKLREMLDARVQPGAEVPQVEQALIDLRILPIDQDLAESPEGPRLRAWVWEPGGPQPPLHEDDLFRWVEVLFRFDPGRHLQDYEISRHSVLGMAMRYPLTPRRNWAVRPQPGNP